MDVTRLSELVWTGAVHSHEFHTQIKIGFYVSVIHIETHTNTHSSLKKYTHQQAVTLALLYMRAHHRCCCCCPITKAITSSHSPPKITTKKKERKTRVNKPNRRESIETIWRATTLQPWVHVVARGSSNRLSWVVIRCRSLQQTNEQCLMTRKQQEETTASSSRRGHLGLWQQKTREESETFWIAGFECIIWKERNRWREEYWCWWTVVVLNQCAWNAVQKINKQWSVSNSRQACESRSRHGGSAVKHGVNHSLPAGTGSCHMHHPFVSFADFQSSVWQNFLRKTPAVSLSCCFFLLLSQNA